MKKIQKRKFSSNTNSRKEAILSIVTVILVFFASGILFGVFEGIVEEMFHINENNSELCGSILSHIRYNNMCSCE